MPRPVLKPFVGIRREEFGVILYRGGSDQIQAIHPVAAYVLTLMDGRRTLREIAEALAGELGRGVEDAMEIVEVVLDRYADYVDLEGSHVKDLPSPEELLEGVPAEIPPEEALYGRLSAPTGFGYIVTHACPNRCRYCYAAAWRRTRLEDDLVPLDVMLRTVDEAADVGVKTILMTGGEPFMRPDLVDIVERGLKRDIFVYIPTKSLITEEKARRLSEAGLGWIQVSIDSPNPETEDFLVGPGAHRRLTTTVRNLVRHGIDVRVNSVVTSYNVREVPRLIEWLYELGVSKISLSPYQSPHDRTDDDLFPSVEDYAWLLDRIEELPRHLREMLDPAGIRAIENAVRVNRDELEDVEALRRCSAGRSSLVILPDGRVSFCERVALDERFVVGDLRKQSLMEVWRSERLERLVYPPRELFSGTACHDCPLFDECTRLGKRCYVRAMDAYGEPFAPDPICPAAPRLEGRFV